MTASIDTLLKKRHVRRLGSGGDMREALRELPVPSTWRQRRNHHSYGSRPALRRHHHANVAALPHNRYGRSESISWIN